MKFKLSILCIAATLFVSCSDDDNLPVNSAVEKNLASTINYSYFNGTPVSRIETYFTGNKPIEMKFYSGNTAYQKYFYTYGADGQVSELNVYNMNNQHAVVIAYSYDGEHRLTQMVSTDLIVWDEIQYGQQTKVFIYNSDNTITVTNSNSGNFQNQFVYEFNGDGKIYRAVMDGAVMFEVQYDGQNAASAYISGQGTMSYTYDNIHTVKGELNNLFKNQMSGYEHNHILNGGLIDAIWSSDKYLIHQIGTEGENEASYVYVFDADGYPIQRKTFTGNESQPDSITEITYE